MAKVTELLRVEPEFELRSSDSKPSALCSIPCYLMQGTVSTIKNMRRRLARPTKVRIGFAETTKGGVKWAWKTSRLCEQ